MELVAINGKIATLQESFIPITDRGFLYGEAVSEVIVGFADVILNFDHHYSRLQKSAANMGIAMKFTQQELEFELKTLAEQLPTTALKKSFRILITNGNGFGLEAKADQKANKMVFALPAPVLPAKIYADGIGLMTQKLGFKTGPHQAKTTQYGQRTAANRQAKAKGFDDVLFVNSESEFTEAMAANIFFVARHGDAIEICTPAESTGILPGITRQTILDLCKKAGIVVHSKIIYEEELAGFDEAFVCSTVRGLIPVHRIDKHKLHTAREQSAFQQIKRLHQAWVASQVGHKVDWNTGTEIK